MMNLPIFYDQLNFYRKLRPKIEKGWAMQHDICPTKYFQQYLQ